QHRRDRRRQRRLPMVHVTNRPYIHVRLRPLKLRPGHLVLRSVVSYTNRLSAARPVRDGRGPNSLVPMARIERATSPLPRECSTTELHGREKNFTGCGLPAPQDAGAGEGNRTLVVSLE